MSPRHDLEEEHIDRMLALAKEKFAERKPMLSAPLDVKDMIAEIRRSRHGQAARGMGGTTPGHWTGPRTVYCGRTAQQDDHPMTYDSWNTTEPSPDYVPDDDPPCEMPDVPGHGALLSHIDDAITWADALGLHATITIRITSPDGSVVGVTKQSEMARMGKQ